MRLGIGEAITLTQCMNVPPTRELEVRDVEHRLGVVRLLLTAIREGSLEALESVFSPTLDRPIALALVRGGGSRLGERVGVYHLGAEQSATIVTACQFDPDGERLHA